jgi:hypothetical protein
VTATGVPVVKPNSARSFHHKYDFNGAEKLPARGAFEVDGFLLAMAATSELL